MTNKHEAILEELKGIEFRATFPTGIPSPIVKELLLPLTALRNQVEKHHTVIEVLYGNADFTLKICSCGAENCQSINEVHFDLGLKDE